MTITSDDVRWQLEKVTLVPAPHLQREELVAALQAEQGRSFTFNADKLAWLERCESGQAIDIGCLQIGSTRILHMPGELFVEYQLAAKQMRPDLHVAMAAYGEYGPGYIGTTIAYEEGGYETSPNASNVEPATESVLMSAMQKLLGAGSNP